MRYALKSVGRGFLLIAAVACCRNVPTPHAIGVADANAPLVTDAHTVVSVAKPPLSLAMASPDGRWIIALRSASLPGADNELIILESSTLRVLGRHEIRMPFTSGEDPNNFVFLHDNRLRVSHEWTIDGGYDSESFIVDLPSGQIVERWSTSDRDGVTVLYRSSTPPFEFVRTADPLNDDAPRTFTLISGQGGKHVSVDITEPARRALGTPSLTIRVVDVVGNTAVFVAQTTRADRYDWRVGLVNVTTGQISFLKHIFGAGGSFSIAGDQFVAVEAAESAPIVVDLKSQSERVFLLPHSHEPSIEKMDPVGDPQTCVALDPSSGLVVFGQSNGPTRWFALASGKQIGSVFAPSFETNTRWRACAVSVSNDGRRIMTFSEKGFVAMADATTSKLLVVRDDGDSSHRDGPTAIGNVSFFSTAVLSADASHYAIARTWSGSQRRTRVIALSDNGSVELPVEYPFAFAHDGHWLVGSDGVWSIADSRRVMDIP